MWLESNSLRLNRAWPAFHTFEHDLIGKPVSTFPDHALGANAHPGAGLLAGEDGVKDAHVLNGIVNSIRNRFVLKNGKRKGFRLLGILIAWRDDFPARQTAIERQALVDQNGRALIRVSDTGVGIDTESQGRVFEKFTRVENELSNDVNGSGVGLYLTNEIVNLHNGHIELESELNKGSTFTISLPFTYEKPEVDKTNLQ